MSNVTQLSRPVDEHLVAILEETLKWAKEGKLLGSIMLLNLPGNQYTHVAAGDMQFSEALLAFEAFKFEQLFATAQERKQS